jgi:phosphate acetyltransferase
MINTIDQLMTQVYKKARQNKMTILLPEADDSRTIMALKLIEENDTANIILVGNPDKINTQCKNLGINCSSAQIIDPQTSELTERYIEEYHKMRAHKKMTLQRARELIKDPVYFATMYLNDNRAHGFVSGAIHTTGDTIRPALEIIKTRAGSKTVSSVFFMGIPDRLSIFADCAVNPCPDAGQLADIAIDSADTAIAMGMDPKVGLISFSTKGSAKHELVTKVTKALEIAQKRRPDLEIDGEMQFDAAFVPEVARLKYGQSEIAGRVNVFIFPDLQVGNCTYKAVQRVAGVPAIGPLLQGLRKSVNDLSRGCSAEDIANLVALTAVQAQQLTGHEA